MDTLTRETTAVAYERALLANEGPSLDLWHQSVERDAEGTVLARDEAGIDNVRAAAWGTEAAEDVLAEQGWRRTGPWDREDDLGGVPGWTAPVERV